MLLLLDNYDSFTYILADYFKQLGIACRVVRNDELSVQALLALKPSCMVLSPGPETPAKAGVMMDLLEAAIGQLPILGVCLGHQAIGEFFGARLVKAKRPMHGMSSEITVSAHPVFAGLDKRLTVMRYHSLLIEDLESTDLRGIAYTDDGELMALAHDELMLLGLQFHPESILTSDGLEMLNNWLVYNNIPTTSGQSSIYNKR